MLANWRHLSLVSLGALIIKAVGLLRGVIVAGFIGANSFLDAYYGVLVIIGFFIFVFSDQLEMLVSEAGAKTKDFKAFASNALTTTFFAGLFMTAFLYIALPIILPILLPDLKNEHYLFTTRVTALMGVLCCIYPPYRVVLALFRCRSKVAMQVGIDATNSLLFCGLTLPALFFSRHSDQATQVFFLAASHSIAFFLAFCLSLYLWKRINGRVWGPPSLALVQELGQKAATLSIVHYSLYLFTFIDRYFAGIAAPGGVSLLGFAGNISLTARSLINFEQIYLIDFSRSENKHGTIRLALLQNAVLSSSVGIFILVFSVEIIQMIYQRGAFSPEMSHYAGSILAVYGLSTLPFLWWGLLFRALQVQGLLNRLPLFIGLLIPVDLVITKYAVKTFGVGGAVCGTLICHIALVSWAFSALKRAGLTVITLKDIGLILALNLALLGGGSLIKEIAPYNGAFVNFIIQSVVFGVFSLSLVAPLLHRLTSTNRRVSSLAT